MFIFNYKSEVIKNTIREEIIDIMKRLQSNIENEKITSATIWNNFSIHYNIL